MTQEQKTRWAAELLAAGVSPQEVAELLETSIDEVMGTEAPQ
jgi:hypothetical protein